MGQEIMDDDRLKRRMELARKQGMAEEDVQRAALLERAQQSIKQRQQPQVQPQKQSTGAFRSNSALGFATSLLPFGEVLRKKAAGEKITGGDVALETALTALPIAGKLVGKGVKAVKGLTAAQKAAKVVGKTAKVAEDVNKEKNLLKLLIKGTPEEGAISGRLTKAGESLKAQARGVIPGVKPQGAAEKLLPSQADEINKTLNTVERGKSVFGRTKTGAKGSVNKQLRTVETAQSKALTDMDTILAEKNKVLTPKDTSEIVKNMRTERKGILGLKKEHLKEATDLETRVAKTKDVKELEALRRSADKRINFARNPNSPDPALEEVYLSLRRNIDKKTTQLVPDLKVAKTNYGKLEAAKDTLVQSSPATMRQFAGQGATSRILGGSTAQSLTDKAGRVLTRTAKITASPITQQAGIRLPFSTASAIGAGQPEQLPQDPSQIFQTPQNSDEEAINQLVANGVTDPQEMFDALSGQGDYAQQTDELAGQLGGFQSQYGLEQYMEDINNDLATTGGKNVDKLNKIFTTVQSAEKEQRKAKAPKDSMGNVGKVSAKDYSYAKDGLNSISDLENIIKQDPNIVAKTNAPGGSLPLVGGYIRNAAGVADYDQAAFNTIDTLLRIRTGAAAPDSEIRRYMVKLIPRPGDTPKVIENKLSKLKQSFSETLSLASLDDESNKSNFSDDELVQQLTEQRGY